MKTIYNTIALGSFLLLILSACQSEIKNDAAYERYKESRLKVDTTTTVEAASVAPDIVSTHKTKPNHTTKKLPSWLHVKKKHKRS